MDVLKVALVEICETDDDDEEMLRQRKKRRKTMLEEFLYSKRKISKITNYMLTVDKYQPDIFKSHFSLNRSSVEKLCSELTARFNEVIQNAHGGRANLLLFQRILITLWTLSNQESFRKISDRFGVSQSTAHRVFLECCKLISEKSANYIKWPNNYQYTADGFSNLKENPFPGVIGAIDCMNIPIISPKNDKISYYNRKGIHTIKLQAICDSNMKFINAFVGAPGACHDASVWRSNSIFKRLSSADTDLPPNLHLVGDSAYPLDMFLMKPFEDNGQLTIQQKYFNKVLNSTRCLIENAFGHLKSRFRRLNYLHMVRISDIKEVAIAACVLHNFIIMNEDDGEILNVSIANILDENDAIECKNFSNRFAERKRNKIAAHLRYE